MAAKMEDAKMECSYAVLSLATVGLLSLGSFIGFTVLVIFALARAPPDTAKPDLVAVPGDAAAVTWQAAELMFDLAGRMQKGEPIEGALVEVSRALRRVADRFPQVLR
jgi:hypothetical protein